MTEKNPKTNGKKGNRDSIYIPDDQLPVFREIDAWCKNNGIVKSDFFREAIVAAYKKNKHLHFERPKLNFDYDLPSLKRGAPRESVKDRVSS